MKTVLKQQENASENNPVATGKRYFKRPVETILKQQANATSKRQWKLTALQRKTNSFPSKNFLQSRREQCLRFLPTLPTHVHNNPRVVGGKLLQGPTLHCRSQCCLNTISSFFLKWANHGLFFVYFQSFLKKHQYNFATNSCEKCPSSIWPWDSNSRPS